MAVKFIAAKEYRTGYIFERTREGATTKERMYIRKQTLAECGIDPTKGITIVQYEEGVDSHDPR